MPLLRSQFMSLGCFLTALNLSRKGALALAFVLLGVLGFSSSLMLLVEEQGDPRDAFAFAPASAPTSGLGAPAEVADIRSVESSAEPLPKSDLDPCRYGRARDAAANCRSAALPEAVEKHAAKAPAAAEPQVTPTPGIPAVAVAPAVLPASAPAVETAAAPAAEAVEPPSPAAASEPPAPAAPAAPPAAEAAAPKLAKAARHQASRQSYRRSANYRPRFFPFFW
jgi:hypothetical protein